MGKEVKIGVAVILILLITLGFVNKTNGVTFRRWLYLANPGLTTLLIEACGERAAESVFGAEQFVDRPHLVGETTITRNRKDSVLVAVAKQ